MLRKFQEGKDLIIDTVANKLNKNTPKDSAAMYVAFFRQFFGTISLEDLREWSVDDLYAACINFWSLIERRAPKELKVHIYNPDFERYGWQSNYTIIEVICDDMPFLVDSLRIVLKRMGLPLHLAINMGGMRLTRGIDHEITAILPQKTDATANVTDEDILVEAPILFKIDRQTDPIILQQLQKQLELVLKENYAVSEDWAAMRHKVAESIEEIDHLPITFDADEISETQAFLYWLENHHFTFLGVADFDLVQLDGKLTLQAVPNTGYGVLRNPKVMDLSFMPSEAMELTLSARILIISKTNTLANIHRDAYTDYIGIKRFNKQGEVIGERRILGLYTSAAYNTNPKHIPFLRHKVDLVIKESSLNPSGHSGKVLLNILETLPRDDLIQASESELLDIAMGIFYMQERRCIRMFARMDLYHRFVSCLVYVPRDRFNTDLRKAMEAVLRESFNAKSIIFSTYFSESVLARINFFVQIDPQSTQQYDFNEIEKKLIAVGRTWTDDLRDCLLESFGGEIGNDLFLRYKEAFPAVYMTNFPPQIAVLDIKHLEQLSEHCSLRMNLYRPLKEQDHEYRLKIYQRDATSTLSDVLPIIENLGLRAISERPYGIKFSQGKRIWIDDFLMNYLHESTFEFDDIKELFQNAFTKIWFREAENDGFNKLVLAAGLDWRQVSILRMYAKYFKQIAFTFSQDYIESSLMNNTLIAKKLVNLFELRFNPISIKKRQEEFKKLHTEILNDLDDVANLDEDKIIRQYIQIISATVRTNYYQRNSQGDFSTYLSIKLNSKEISGMPRPYPLFEIFVYSPQFEGIHLRAAKVARGGLRWSDRREDFRTEILGLMKAQQVKNSVIVPSGAKGGFVVKQPLLNATREEILAEGIACYQKFIRGLLDITDNYNNAEIKKPAQVVCYDEDDPYLVVAADKGTATFSDIANAISLEYGFWLGDAFASGGSIGYDHKKMGITAKGAWESVKCHFYELGINTDTTDFSVVGIGDMSGDVFGNGMLLSKHIKLLAAFNHVHIFIDPNPDTLVSFNERLRLFQQPRLSWADYNPELISPGGGVFKRSAKSIAVSKEMAHFLGIKTSVIEPNELIKMILRAQVDLLWSAGIGTFVKAQSETNNDVGDRTNDAIRINSQQLRCKVVGEGGNLGLTQLARVEYALNNGLIYTDFIDNSAGVSCSDKEVNIKILLNSLVTTGDLTFKQRNLLLSDMTEEVSRLVLRENYLQTRAISLIATQAVSAIELHSRYINKLSQEGKIDREIEFLPNEKTLMQRKMLGKGLSSPEIAILLCYSKINLKEDILASDVPEDPYMKQFLLASFPKALQERYSQQMQDHRLKREIIATRVSNLIVNEMGFSFIFRLQDETGAKTASIVRAYLIARAVFDMDATFQKLESLDGVIVSSVKINIMMSYIRMLRRATRWFLRNERMRLDISQEIADFSEGVRSLKDALPNCLGENFKSKYDSHIAKYRQQGVPEDMLRDVTTIRGLFSAMDIIEISASLKIAVPDVAAAYFGLGEFLDLAWIRTKIIINPSENHWEALMREALRDDLDWQQRQLTLSLLHYLDEDKNFATCLESWSKQHVELIQRWRSVLTNLRSATLNYTMFFVAIRELLDLTHTTIQVTKKNT